MPGVAGRSGARRGLGVQGERAGGPDPLSHRRRLMYAVCRSSGTRWPPPRARPRPGSAPPALRCGALAGRRQGRAGRAGGVRVLGDPFRHGNPGPAGLGPGAPQEGCAVQRPSWSPRATPAWPGRAGAASAASKASRRPQGPHHGAEATEFPPRPARPGPAPGCQTTGRRKGPLAGQATAGLRAASGPFTLMPRHL